MTALADTSSILPYAIRTDHVRFTHTLDLLSNVGHFDPLEAVDISTEEICVPEAFIVHTRRGRHLRKYPLKDFDVVESIISLIVSRP